MDTEPSRNIEIKARVADPSRMRSAVERLADRGPVLIEQEDIFFPCEAGRLKLRKLGGSRGELIHYHRADSTEPVPSAYRIVPTSRPGPLAEILTHALGTRGVVRKRRNLYLLGRTRIHLDEVDRLGHFIELEVVLRPEETAAEGMRSARALMRELGILEADLVAGAYIDLLREGRGK